MTEIGELKKENERLKLQNGHQSKEITKNVKVISDLCKKIEELENRELKEGETVRYKGKDYLITYLYDHGFGNLDLKLEGKQ
jgi:hypothetical protein